MKRVFMQGVLIVAGFFIVWLTLQQVDWMKVFRIEKMTQTTEEKLGKFFWELFSKSEKTIDEQIVRSTIDSLLQRICNANNIDQTQIKIHVLKKDEINAFALPDHHLVLYSGLIADCEDYQELVGVICHEMAHMELNHVMKKLIKEIGLSALISLSTGGGGDATKGAMKVLSSTAYDRKLEKEADLKAVEYMLKSRLDPEHFANFLYRLSQSDPTIMRQLSWVSTHPGSEERAAYIIEAIRDRGIDYLPALSPGSWEQLLATLNMESHQNFE